MKKVFLNRRVAGVFAFFAALPILLVLLTALFGDIQDLPEPIPSIMNVYVTFAFVIPIGFLSDILQSLNIDWVIWTGGWHIVLAAVYYYIISVVIAESLTRTTTIIQKNLEYTSLPENMRNKIRKRE